MSDKTGTISSYENQRVLFCTQTFPPRLGGMEAVMFSLAEKFTLHGSSVLVAADKPFKQPTEYDFFAVNVPRFIRSFIKRFALETRRFEPNLTICDSWKSVVAVPRQSGKVIVLAHGQEYLGPSTKRQTTIRKALSRADLVIASSTMTANLVSQLSPAVPVEVVYPTYMVKRSKRERRADRHAQETRVIVSLCRIEKRKGLLQSARALMQLHEEGFKFTWKIAGSGPDLAELESFVKGSEMASACQFLGRVSDQDKDDLLGGADLFLMPSYQEGKSLEGFGISYIEAAKYGVASIAGEVGGAPEAVLNGVTGWCVDGSSADAIAEALRDALTDSVKLEHYGLAALQRFDAELSGEVTFEKLLRLSQISVDSERAK